jgi:hypothetical protein
MCKLKNKTVIIYIDIYIYIIIIIKGNIKYLLKLLSLKNIFAYSNFYLILFEINVKLFL